MRTLDRDFRNVCSMMIVLRVICVGAALSLIAVLAGTGLEIKNALLLAGLLSLVLPLSVVWWLVFKSGRALRQLAHLQLAADLGLATGIVYATGGALSHFTLLYFITILVASILSSMRGAILTATLSSLLYIAASVGQYARYQRSSLAIRGEATWPSLVLSVGLEVACFYFMAILSGYLSEKILVSGARLTSTSRELRRIRMDTHSIIDSMSSGFVIIDPDLTVTEFNRSASCMLGVSKDQMLGRKAEDVIAPLSADLLNKIVKALRDGSCEERGEVDVVTRDGREIPLGLSVSLLKGDNGEAGGAVLVFQDLTEVKRMAERVRSADRFAVLGEMSAAIAHEIRTPLASISGAVEMLSDSLDARGENKQLLDLVVKESERLKSIIDHFLEFARSKPSRLREIALNSIVAEVVCLVRNHPAFNAGIRIEAEAPAPVRVLADGETIKQVFYNLALNAVEALPKGGVLRIKLEVPATEEGVEGGGYAVVAFEDNGVGIDPADLKHVFEPFFTKKKAGTGLGLAIASKIVQEHGGKIEINSKKGLGTTVTVFLPLDKLESENCYCGFDSMHVLAEAAKQGGVI